MGVEPLSSPESCGQSALSHLQRVARTCVCVRVTTTVLHSRRATFTQRLLTQWREWKRMHHIAAQKTYSGLLKKENSSIYAYYF
jgi:hypothetical protein